MFSQNIFDPRFRLPHDRFHVRTINVETHGSQKFHFLNTVKILGQI